MKFREIVFVTGNRGKVNEAEDILGIPLKVADLELDEIQSLDLEKIALHKLNQAYNLLKKPVIIDDVSLEIEEWNGFPGPLVKWLLKTSDGDARVLLKMLKGVKNRRVKARLAVGYHDGKIPRIFYGEVNGTIAENIRGKNGFGWDPVFIPEGSNRTFAEMSVSEKGNVSHRRKGLEVLKEFLDSQ